MAITFTTVTVTENGTLAVPANCTCIAALVHGSVLAPEIAGIPMETICEQDAVMSGTSEKVKAVSIHQYKPAAGGVNLAFTMSGNKVVFVYLLDTDGKRPGPVFGTATSGSLTGELATSTDDVVFGILAGMIGPCALKGDTVEMTYLVDETYEKVGWIVPGDASLTVLATDSGVSAGYYIDGGTKYHPAVLVSEAYTSYDPVKHTVTWKFDHRIIYPEPWWGYYWRKVVDGVVSTGALCDARTNTSTPPNNSIYYTYPGVYHPAVYTDAYTENLPDIWVPGGESASLSACFASFRSSGAGQFVGRPMIWG